MIWGQFPSYDEFTIAGFNSAGVSHFTQELIDRQLLSGPTSAYWRMHDNYAPIPLNRFDVPTPMTTEQQFVLACGVHRASGTRVLNVTLGSAFAKG
jgi:hypothetical protein